MTDVTRAAPAASQTLTFLFSDLRDYTRFVEQFGDAAATALIGDYRRIVRAEVAKMAGAEIKTEGDSFYVVFTSARSAVTGAMAILREADRYSRARPDRPMRIGIGIHAGEPMPHEGQYVGSAVIVAARLAQASTAGELLVSDVVRALLPRDVAPMAERTGLVLKGLTAPPAVFAVEWPRATDERTAVGGALEIAIEAPPPADRRILCPTLVGRDGEIAALVSALDRTSAGEARTVMVGAEAGLGKSAVLRAFLERAREAGALVLFGECSEIEARRPFGPVIDAFQAAGISLPDDLRVGGPGAQSVSEVERYRAHAAFTDAIAGQAIARPVVLAIDDLHWADEATLELIPYLARKLRTARVLVVAAYRTDEMHRTHPLNHVLAELARSRLADEVRLHHLTEDETAAVITGALGLGRAPTSAFRRAIHERCEGNPFFIEEVLRALVERGDLAYREGAWRRTKDVADIAIPMSVRDAVQQRLRGLGPSDLRALQVAAVIGQRFEFDLLQRVAGISEPDLLAALRVAVEEQLVEEESEGDRELYRFRHALTRETVLADLLQRERRLLHRTIGETLERGATDLDAIAEDLAYHFDEARDAERAFRYHEAAARGSLVVRAFGRALRHLERAVELAPDDDRGLGSLLLRLSDVAFQMNELDRSRQAAAEARRVFEATGDAAGQGAAYTRSARMAWYFGRTDEAFAEARRAVELLEPGGGGRELSAAYGEVARLEMLAGRRAEAVATAERAERVARAAGDLELELDARLTAATASGQDEPESTVLALRQILADAEGAGLVRVALRAYQNLIATAIRAGLRYVELVEIHQAGLRYMRRYGVEDEGAAARQNVLSFTDGEWDRVLERSPLSDTAGVWAKGRVIHSRFVLLAREGPDEHLPALDALASGMAAAGDPQWVAFARAMQVSAHDLAGDPRGAVEAGAAILQLGGNPPASSVHSAGMAALYAAVTIGDGAVQGRWRAWLTDAPSAGVHRMARVAFAEAYDAWSAGRHAQATAALDRVASLAADMMVGLTAATAARRWAAEIAARGGDGRAAQRYVDELVPFWRKVRATWYLARLGEWARAHGLEVHP